MLKNFRAFNFPAAGGLWSAFLLVSALVLPIGAQAQTGGDTSGTKYDITPVKAWEKKPKSSIDLVDPIGMEWKYNPRTNRYEEHRTVGSLSYPTGNSKSISDYFADENRKRNEAYLRDKTRNSVSLGSRDKSSITDYLKGELNNPAVSKIFGPGGVDFQLSGSAMVKFGGNFNVNRNPNFSKRQQKYFVPIFDQQIQIAANGSVGDYVKLGINYDTEAAFDFDNQTNLGWKGKPDAILKDVQVGNVSLNLPTQLIKPSNNLFGLSTTMQFGKTTVKSVFSQNKGQSTETVLQGGAQLNQFRLSADNYDQNRHYFLAQFFRDNYDRSMQNLPIVASGVIINRVEVWVTNVSASIDAPRDVLMFQDLGEGNPYRSFLGGTPNSPPDNNANLLYANIQNNDKVRRPGNAIDELNVLYPAFEQSLDYDIINYARQLGANDYTMNAQLGFISLNQALNNDEMLAVAYEYQYNGQTYTVGEFSRDVTTTDQKFLMLKMLKGTTIRTKLPVWDLMMKNIYSLNTYSLSLDEFKLDIIYQDDTSGADYNYLPTNLAPQVANGVPLIRVMGLDKLNRQLEAKPDGRFDALEGKTVNTQFARIIFPEVEPFGSYLRTKLDNNKDLGDYYAFDALYDSTKWLAQQDVKHNKFFLVGSYKSQNGAEIFLGTTNLAKGSVRVTANGRPLTEGSDYSVDYALGRVTILNQGLLQGGAEIRASADGQSFFNINQRTLVGGRIDHKFNKHLQIGGTALHMYERAITTKTNFGEEPILNSILGTDIAYSNQSRFLTKLVDKLPFIETKQISNITAYGEFAKIFPHNHRSQGGQRGVSNLDDFENAELPNDYKNVTNWVLASVPQKQLNLFPETQDFTKKLKWLDHVAKLSFYTIDPLFFSDADMPDNIKARADEILSDPYQRQVGQRELFPQRNYPAGTPTILPTLDLIFRPNQRGQYNFNSKPGDLNANGELLDPKKSWGGIMRKVDQNDFEAANIDYIEIWMLDPLIKNPNLSGDFYINLGNVSEDILPDRRKIFENGLPADGNYANTDTTEFSIVPTIPQVNFAFDTDKAIQQSQDLGLDGMSDDQERLLRDSFLQAVGNNFGFASPFYFAVSKDPSNDNFLHYLEGVYDGDDADIINRYRRFQNAQGNNNLDEFGAPYEGMRKSSSPNPSDEDVNRDFILSQSEDYYQYRIKIGPTEMEIGKNYIADIVRTQVKLRNGQEEEYKWYQLKIPIRQFEKAVGNISDFKSIRFMRMFLTNFTDSVVLRLGYVNMVRAEWRRYTNSLKAPGVIIPADPNDGTKFIVSTVNLEENGKRAPIAYVVPPGVKRVQNLASLGVTQENEQSLSLRVCDLKPGDSRAAFKTTQMDVRNYKNLQMFLHAEAPTNPNIKDGEVSAFIRFGTDLTNNYYEYEIPLKFTREFVNSQTPGADKIVWPDENFIDLEFQKLYDLKIERTNAGSPVTAIFAKNIDKGRISVLGLPDVGNLRVMMIGVRNNSDQNQCFEIWSNELRVKDIANQGGWAALANVQAQLADFGQVSAGGTIRTIGFGDVDKKLNERSLNRAMSYDVASNLELGRFFPRKAGVSIPMYIGYSENYIQPKFYPLNPDIQLQHFLSGIADKGRRQEIRKAAEDYSSLYSFNINNIHVALQGKARPWKLSNFNAGYAYQNNYRRNQQIQEMFTKTRQLTLGYSYAFTAKPWKPFGKLKPSWLKPLKEFNINLVPATVSAQAIVNRLYSEQQARNNNSYKQINPRLYDKNFTMNRIYNLSWNPFSSLNVNFNANAMSRIEEPYGALNTKEKRDTVKREFFSLGHMSKYNQSFGANYTLPFKYFGFLDWVSSTVNYSGSYQWDQAPPAFPELGSTIQNSRTISLQGTLNFRQLYQKSAWLRNLENPKAKKTDKSKDPKDPHYESAIDKSKDSKEKVNPMKLFVGNFIMMFKNAGFNYTNTQGTLLPGFSYRPDYFGHNFKHIQPGLDFVFGAQRADIRHQLANEGALNKDPRQSNFYVKGLTESISANVTVEPIKDFRIQLDLSRSEMKNTQSQFRWNGTEWVDDGLMENGQYNISGIFLKTHFIKDKGLKNSSNDKKSDEHPNAVFDAFLANRFTVAQRLMNQDPRVTGFDPNTGFPLGYSANSQNVLVGSFLAAYSGKDAGRTDISGFPKIPLPGWTINYNGLGKIKALKRIFSNINIKHSYNGKYSISGFSRNLRYDANEVPAAGKDFVPLYHMADVTVSEGFFPLIGVNIATKNNWTMGFDYKRSRTVKLFAAYFNVTEQRSNELQLNAGYRVTGLTLPFKRNGRRVYLPNDFRFDLAVAVQDNVTAVRKIDIVFNKYTAGMRTVRISPTVSYQINQKLNVSFKYNRMVLNPKVSTQYFTALTDFGLELRYTLN